MPPPAEPSRRPAGRPPATSRGEILAAARRLIERGGWKTLTIRGLAAELGVGSTTLYHHIRDREDLLIQLLNDHATHTLDTGLPARPRDRIIAAATAIHDSLAAWPWAAEVLTVDGLLGRLGDSAVSMVEGVVSGAIEDGCSRDQAVDLFRHIWFYTVGEILVRAHSGTANDGSQAVGNGERFFENVDAARTPRLAEIGDRWPVLAARDTFAEGLRAFVDGLLSQASRPTP